MPVCGGCKHLISERKWLRHQKRCPRRRKAKELSRNIGVTLAPQTLAENEYKEELRRILENNVWKH